MSSSGARLEVVAGNAAGMSIVVEDELIIGRHAQGAGRLADDEEISRSHARITVDASGFCAIEDLGSTNGTFVNGLRISAPQTLSEGDMVELGATTLVTRELPRTEAEPQTTPRRPQPTVRSAGESPPLGPELTEEEAVVPPSLSLHLEVDFAAHEAHLFLNESSEPVRLAFDAGAWRLSTSPPTDKGDQA